jgi:hypothetical protein
MGNFYLKRLGEVGCEKHPVSNTEMKQKMLNSFLFSLIQKHS